MTERMVAKLVVHTITRMDTAPAPDGAPSGNAVVHAARQHMVRAHRIIGDRARAYVADLDTRGVRRLATPADYALARVPDPQGGLDKKGRPKTIIDHALLPSDCAYPAQVAKDLFGMIRSVFSTYTDLGSCVRNSVDRQIAGKEFDGPKLQEILRGNAFVADLRRVVITVSSSAWRLAGIETRTGKDGGTYLVPVLEVRPLFSKGHLLAVPLRIECDWIDAKRGAYLLAKLGIFERFGWHEGESAPHATKEGKQQIRVDGWHKGTLNLREVHRPGQRYAQTTVSLVADREADFRTGLGVLAVHRGVVNALTAVWSDGAGRSGTHYYPGTEIIEGMVYYAQRRRRAARSVSTLGGGRGQRRRYRALAWYSRREQQYKDTACWRAARWLQNLVEEHGIATVVRDDFTGFDFGDVHDDQGGRVRPFMRTFPFAKLGTRIDDAIKRRAHVVVAKLPGAYNSQTCPLCGHRDKANVASVPRVGSALHACAECKLCGRHKHMRPEPRDGRFCCQQCGLSGNLDAINAWNLLVRAGGEVPAEAMAAARDAIGRLRGHMAATRAAKRGEAAGDAGSGTARRPSSKRAGSHGDDAQGRDA